MDAACPCDPGARVGVLFFQGRSYNQKLYSAYWGVFIYPYSKMPRLQYYKVPTSECLHKKKYA